MSFQTPFERHRETVQPGWIDYNGHMNVAYYVLVFDHGTDALFEALDVGAGYVARTNRSMFAAEAHVAYEREVRVGDMVRVVSWVLGADHKRLHMFHEMFHAEGGWRAASIELMALHVDLGLRRTVPFDEAQRERLAGVVASHQAVPLPKGIGRRIGMS